MKFAIDEGIGISPTIVEVDNFFQRRDRTIVHVWTGARNLAQRGGLEGASIGFLSSDGEAPGIAYRSIFPGNAGVMELLGSANGRGSNCEAEFGNATGRSDLHAR